MFGTHDPVKCRACIVGSCIDQLHEIRSRDRGTDRVDRRGDLSGGSGDDDNRKPVAGLTGIQQRSAKKQQ